MTAERWASLAGAGLFAGAAAWALHQQAGIIIASWNCETASDPIWQSGGLAATLLLVGAIASGAALSATRWLRVDAGRPRRFLATVSLMAIALFFFAIALQVCAALFLPGCAG
jgi:hypothetical protein